MKLGAQNQEGCIENITLKKINLKKRKNHRGADSNLHSGAPFPTALAGNATKARNARGNIGGILT